MKSSKRAFLDNYPPDVRKYYRRNYTAHSVEGGLYLGGLVFLAAETVMPTMIKSLGGPNIMIALAPSMLFMGFIWPPILTAHLVERLNKVKPFAWIMGFFQRLPYLLTGLLLWFFADNLPTLVLLMAFLTPFLSGMFGGSAMGAWIELVSRAIPAERRSSSSAIRNIISTIMGLIAGGVIEQVLSQHPGAKGYAMLHLICYGILMISFAIFSLIKEPNFGHAVSSENLPRRGLWENLKTLPQLLREDRQFRYFMLSRASATMMFVTMPYLAIHFLDLLDKPESFTGQLVQAQMVGGICGNLFAGYIGDRFGGRGLLIWARILFITVCAGAILAQTEWSAYLVFFFLGWAWFYNMVGNSTMSIEICPPGRRPTYIAFIQMASLPFLLVSALISATIREFTQSIVPLGVVSIIGLSIALYSISKTYEPRNSYLDSSEQSA